MPRQQTLHIDIQHIKTPQGPAMGLILTLFSMLMLTLSQEPVHWSWLAWIALAPWTLAVARARSARKTLLISYVLGLVYFLTNFYWLANVTLLGYIALCFYLALYFVFCGAILRSVYLNRHWPFTLVLPILWVGQEFLRATVMTGFPWLLIAHSQHHHYRLIQISDLIGAYGVTFLVVMVNGLFCDMLLRPIKRAENQKRRFGLMEYTLFTACCIIASILYGQLCINQSKTTMTTGPTLSVIQDVIPQYVKEQGESDEEIFQRHLTLSEQALSAPPKSDLIVWPETMVPAPLNQDFLHFPKQLLTSAGQTFQAESLSYHHRLEILAKDNANLLVGAAGFELTPSGDNLRFNSAYFYRNNGTAYHERYDKMHLVPFGEVVPFKKSWPWLYNVLNQLTPYDYDYTLEAGESPTVFEVPFDSGQTARFAVAICYEDVMPQVPRKLAACENGQKRIDFLLNISNDGWFVHNGKTSGSVIPTSELIQHLIMCKFRAVENRIGIARAVNTGISAFIRPDGVIQQKPLAGTLPDNPYDRQAVAGFLTDTIHCDSRTTLYNKTGDLFAGLCTLITALMFADTLYHWRKHKKTSHTI